MLGLCQETKGFLFLKRAWDLLCWAQLGTAMGRGDRSGTWLCPSHWAAASLPALEWQQYKYIYISSINNRKRPSPVSCKVREGKRRPLDCSVSSGSQLFPHSPFLQPAHPNKRSREIALWRLRCDIWKMHLSLEESSSAIIIHV